MGAMETPRLEKPGAGLPFFESLFVRYWVGPIQSRRNSKEQNLKLFRFLGGRVLKEAKLVPADKRDVKVLVPRMKGVEDSSRHWCANEVLEHLMITGKPMRALIETLAAGGTSDYAVNIANFKPQGAYAGRDAAPDFAAFVEETAAALEKLPIADAGPVHLHPWLGRINALQWSWLLAGHNGLHLRQLQAIRAGL
jgi:hypothetical protein